VLLVLLEPLRQARRQVGQGADRAR
jgi:hypothetical protein